MSALPGGSIWRVAGAIAWRSLHTYVRRPDLFVPSLIFPLVFVLRNIWRLHGPAPELDRVQRDIGMLG